MNTTKPQLIAALRAFIAQRSGIDFRNYQCADWKQSRACFMGDYRPILRAGKDARAMLAIVANNDEITADDLIAATDAYAGRLQFKQRDDGSVGVDYCTGQYFPTEYRNAACAVLARALWRHFSKHMPAPTGKTTRTHGPFTTEFDSYNGLTCGDWIKREARNSFGRGVASRWFN